MTETTITFTPLAQAKKGLALLGQGFVLLGKGIGRMTDNSIHKWPYAWLLILVLCGVTTCYYNLAKARLERDALNKQNYVLHQQIDSLLNVSGYKFSTR